jgi:hypothetical protein
MKSIKKWSSFLIIFILVLGFNVSVFAQTFQTSELEGNWYVYGIEVDPTMPAVYWIRGNVNMDESGNLTGTYYAPDGSSVTLSSAQIALDHKGIISGFFTAEGVTATVVHGKMDQSKTFGTSVLLGADSTMDLLSFIKGGGTFTASDLEGTWYAYQVIIDPSTGAVFWTYGTYDVDASGTLTGFFSGPDGSTVTADSGTLSLDSTGIITGNLALSTGQTPVIVHGKMDQGKTRGVVVSTVPDGSMMIGYLNKAGGTFKQSDAAGNWYVYSLNIDPTIPAVYWAYGKAGIDALGNITGSYIAPTGQSIKLTSTFQMNNEGLSTGTFNFDTGDFGILPSIKLDQGKTSMAGVSIITSGSSVGTMSILQFIKESNIAMPWIPLLLLDE